MKYSVHAITLTVPALKVIGQNESFIALSNDFKDIYSIYQHYMQLSNFNFHIVWHPRKGYPAHTKISLHKHPFYELGIVINGTCKWNFKNKKSVTIESGDGILIAPHVLHAEAPLTHCHLAWIGFTTPKDEIKSVKLHRPLALRHQFKDIKEIVEHLESENFLRLDESELRMKIFIAELALLLRRSTSRKPWKNLTLDYNSRLIESAALYLERNCTENLPLEQVARYHGLSHSHFGALFRQRFAVSPKTFQQQSKLRYLENAIASGITSIKALAGIGKFDDDGYFCRWIKCQTGLYPTAWIKRYKKTSTHHCP